MTSKQKHDPGYQKRQKNEELNPRPLTHAQRTVKRKLSRNLKLSTEQELIAREFGWGKYGRKDG